MSVDPTEWKPSQGNPTHTDITKPSSPTDEEKKQQTKQQYKAYKQLTLTQMFQKKEKQQYKSKEKQQYESKSKKNQQNTLTQMYGKKSTIRIQIQKEPTEHIDTNVWEKV
eukprot:72009_1